MSEPLIDEAPLDEKPKWEGKRPFWITFAICALIPIGLLLTILATQDSPQDAYGILFIGAAVAVMADAAFLLTGIIFFFLPGKQAQGAGLILGMLAGAAIGFGICMIPTGIM